MINVNELYLFLNILANKSQTGSSGFSPANYNTLLPRALDDFFKKIYGLPEQYTPGRPIPLMGYEMTQALTDAVKNIRKEPIQLPVDSDGKASYPSDYVHLSTVRYIHAINNPGGEPTVVERKVDFVTDEQLADKLSDPIAPPTLKYPFGILYKDNIQFYPKNLFSVLFTYLNYPAKPVFGYNVDPLTDALVYVPGASVDIDLPENHFNDIARIILGYVGINLSSEMILKYARETQNQGT